MPSRLSSLFSRRQPTEPRRDSTAGPRETKRRRLAGFFSRKGREQTPEPPRPSLLSSLPPPLSSSLPPPLPHGDAILDGDGTTSLPIYQSFVSGGHRSSSTHGRSSVAEPEAGPSRREPSPPRVRSTAASRDPKFGRKLDLRRLPSRRNERRPSHDIATELARSYQAILPDFWAMLAEEDDDVDDEVAGDDDDDDIPYVASRDKGKAIARRSSGGYWRHDASLQATSASRTSSYGSNSLAPSSDSLNPTSRPSSTTTRTTTTTAGRTNQRRAPPDPQRSTDPRRDSPVGLRVCTEMLANELTSALNLQRWAVGGLDVDDARRGMRRGFDVFPPQRSTQRVQMQLMVEAYESMLRRCRYESQHLSELSARSGAEGSGAEPKRAERRRQLGEAVPILEHWLATLLALYTRAFAEDASGGGL